MSKKRDPRLSRYGLSGYNKPKRTPSHPKKSHVVLAKVGSKVKLIKARHRKNIARGKMSPAWWANKVKW
jgi:hypothetical protein